MSSPVSALPLPEIYYDASSSKGCYWTTDDQQRWIPINESSAKRHLMTKGFANKAGAGQPISELDQALVDIQCRQNLDYAGALAGYQSGHYLIGGHRVLVTNSPRFIEPAAGPWPLLNSIFTQMFHDPEHNQLEFFYGWLHVWLRSLYGQRWAPGQALVMAGPVDSCKSLTQSIITAISGGRSAKCYQYMTDRTPFNSEWFQAEHLVVEDDAESTDIRARRHFGAHIKGITVNHEQRCHPKGRPAITLTPRWRFTCSLNDELDRLMVLPPMDADIADKVMLLRVSPAILPRDLDEPDGRQKFWAFIKSELPAFVHFIQAFQIPETLRSQRFGVTHFHHPALLAALGETAPETCLLGLIDLHFQNAASPWSGSATELETMLRSNPVTRGGAERLFRFSSACGVYLHRLAAGHSSGRVTSGGRGRWNITPPSPSNGHHH